MPRALGRDRVEVAAGGRVVLVCETSKNWRARSPGTPTTAEHPGSAVRWEDGFYEVLEVRRQGDGVAYVLAPWDERHAMRVVETYSAEAEAIRDAEHADVVRRSRRHVLLFLLAPLVGSLPGHVQDSFEREYNVPARSLSLASALPLWVAGWIALILLLAASIGGARSLPEPVLVVGVYFLAESSARLAVCFLQGRAIGTLAGTLLYEVWRHLGRTKSRLQGKDVPPEKQVWHVDSDAAQDVLDRYDLLEPAAGLLPYADQAVLRERFGFDGVKWGRASAVFLLVMFGPLAVTSVLGAFLAFAPGDVPKIAIFGGIAVEQVLRLRSLASGRVAPSVLGILVRPFARPLLS